MVSVHSPCSLPGLHTSPISTWNTEQDLLRLLHHYLSANTQTCLNIIVLLSLMTYSTTCMFLIACGKLHDNITRLWQEWLWRRTVNLSDKHIIPTPPNGPKNGSHEMRPPTPFTPGAVKSERALIVSLPTLNSLTLDAIVNLLSQKRVWMSA